MLRHQESTRHAGHSGLHYPNGMSIKPTGRCPRVLMLTSGTLLDETIAALLIGEVDLHCCSCRSESVDTIARLIAREDPESIILCKSADFPLDELNRRLEELEYTGPTRVAVVSVSNTALEVHCKQKLVSTNFKDFQALIKNGKLPVGCQD